MLRAMSKELSIPCLLLTECEPTEDPFCKTPRSIAKLTLVILEPSLAYSQ
jgi:hypothetical protein